MVVIFEPLGVVVSAFEHLEVLYHLLPIHVVSEEVRSTREMGERRSP